MGQAKRYKWRCRSCRSEQGQKSQADEGSGLQSGPSNYAAQLTMLTKKIDSLFSIRHTVVTFVSLPNKGKKLLLLKSAAKQLKITVTTVQATIESFSSKYNSLLASVRASESAAYESRAETSSLRSIVADKSDPVKRL